MRQDPIVMSNLVAPFRGSRVIRLGSVFSPLSLVAFLYVPLLVLYVASSKTVYTDEFGSRKTLSWTGFAYFSLALLTFAVGAKAGGDAVGEKAGRRGGGEADSKLMPAQRRSLAVLLEASLVLCIGAYVVWFGRGVLRAGGITRFFEIWRSDPHRIKEGILTTLPGITTLTQLAVASIPLVVAYGLFRRGSALRVLVVLVFALATARTVLFSERLAFIELVVPIAFLLLAPRKITVPRVVAYALAFLAAAMMFFAVTELRRTYVYTHNFSASRSSIRFFGYYLTSVNNGMAVIDDYPARTPFYSTGEFFWLFPGLRDLRVEHLPAIGTVSLRYQDAFGVDPPHFWPHAFGVQGLDYEFNVFTGPGFLAADFGWAGLIAVLVLGVISGRLYRKSEASVFHRAFYAVWLVGLFEFMRILYFVSTRVFPAYLVFVAAYLIVRRKTRAVAPSISEPGSDRPMPVVVGPSG
jgi:oligosaccharide repeat unit polymerase